VALMDSEVGLAAALILGLVAAAAAWMPTRRALRLDLAAALREE
jgi:ABC-type antimicrobial peptide transport system permease subunit